MTWWELKGFGKIWEDLEESEKIKENLGESERIWKNVKESGKLEGIWMTTKENVREFGKFWESEKICVTERFWEILRKFAKIWWNLRKSWRIW